jgi:hypothetical protein
MARWRAIANSPPDATKRAYRFPPAASFVKS